MISQGKRDRAEMASLSVGYQGEPGAYSEAAAHEAFGAIGRSIVATGFTSFEEVFAALVAGKTEYAAVPIENTLGGSIHVNYDLLLRYQGQIHILGEHSFRVRHALLALPGVKKADIRQAMSHPQALSQTEAFLRNAQIKPVPSYDTAGSAKMVKEQGLRDTAAIASSRAAEVHGLEVLDFGIEDDSNNYTRFLVLGRVRCEIPDGVPTKTSVVFVPRKNEAGALFKTLSVFSVRDIDLSKIESRPFRPGSFATATLTARGGGTPSSTPKVEPDPAAAATSSCDSDPSHPAAKRQKADAAPLTAPGPQFLYAFYVDLLVRRGGIQTREPGATRA